MSGQTLCLNCNAPVGVPHSERCKAIMKADRAKRSALRELHARGRLLTIAVKVPKPPTESASGHNQGERT